MVEHLSKTQKLFVMLSAIFVCNALLAEFIGIKIFSLEKTLQIDFIHWQLFGIDGTLSFTAGVLLWPVVFIMTDVINEYFGRSGVRFISYLTVALILYAFLFALIAIHLAPAPWWIHAGESQGIADMQVAFAGIFGQGLWTIYGSVTAFFIGQLVDVQIYHQVRRRTGEKWVFLRATGSTIISQGVDSYIVLYIAFVIGPQHWSISQWLAVGTVNYVYKVCIAIMATPIIYFSYHAIDRYLGHTQAERLKQAATY